MKIRLYIVTFKRNEVLNENLRSLWASTPPGSLQQVTVLANHPSVAIDPENQRDNLRVVLNQPRMPFAWGNLSKDWNYALLDGFRAWNNPDNVDWVILAQNNIVWRPGWLDELAKHTRLQFISQPTGDQVLAFRIGAVRRVGFFDERFATLHFHEVDYFNRAALQLGHEASINDDHHGHSSGWNHVGCFMINPTHTGPVEKDNLHTMRFWPEMAGILIEKWRLRGPDELHSLSTLMKRREEVLAQLPREINAYPFFWDGCPTLPASLLWYRDLAKKAQPTPPSQPVSMAFRVRRKLRRIFGQTP